MRSRHPQFTTPGAEVERRLDAILATLTREEKIHMIGGQGATTTAVAGKGIPAFRTSDGPVGVNGGSGGATAYPATIALAATWDVGMAYRYGQSAGRDARAVGVHFLLGPGLNIYRSPLCGRNFEYLGEDPYLSGEMAAAYIRGCQDQGVCATAKHYALNFQEYNRYFVSSDVDERTLQEIYLPAFRKAVQGAGVGAVMTAYNRVNGEYCSQNAHLLRGILKGDWGFDGVVMSDWVSTHDAVGAANAGLDLEMPTAECMNAAHLLPAIEDGRVAEDVIDDKVRRLLRVALCFGWLDRPQQDESLSIHSEQSAATALETARQSCVLLKNSDGFLPLDPSRRQKIAVIGPGAHPAVTGGGGSSYVHPWRATSLWEGLQAIAPDAEVRMAHGCDLGQQDRAFQTSEFSTPDGRPGLLGHYFNNRELAGAPALVRTDARMNLFWMLDPPAEGIAKADFSIRWTGSLRPERDGEHVFYFSGGDGEYRVQVGGEVLFDQWGRGHTGARRGYRSLEAGVAYPVQIDYRPIWRYNWVQFGWDHADSVWPDRDEALRLARDADAVVFCGGHSRVSESENADRTFAMPPEIELLLRDVTEINPNTVVVLTGGGNIDMRAWLHRVRAVIHAWYPGQEGGTALAEILFGAVNPSGKLPITCERAWEDRSSFASYHDEDGDKHVALSDGLFCGYRSAGGAPPLFPFGFGLSYTQFTYENLQLSLATVRPGETLAVSFDIVNVGTRPGAEAAQLYVQDEASTLPRPARELKGFAKVALQPGERRRVEICLDEQALAFYDPERQEWCAEPGSFTVLIGASSADIRLRGRFDFQT